VPRALRLAIRLHARYARQRGTVTPLDMILRGLARLLPGAGAILHAHVHLRLAVAGAPTTITRAHARRVPRHLERVAARAVAHDRIVPRPSPVSAVVLDRLTERCVRVDRSEDARPPALVAMAAFPREPDAGLRAVAPPMTPSTLVVRRSVLVVRERETAPPVPETFAPGTKTSDGLPRAPQPAPMTIPLSPGEIGRLTDEVVRTLDRRVVSYRERMGVA
jgi:hypothetical protein